MKCCKMRILLGVVFVNLALGYENSKVEEVFHWKNVEYDNLPRSGKIRQKYIL